MKINEGIEVRFGVNTNPALVSVRKLEERIQAIASKQVSLNVDPRSTIQQMIRALPAETEKTVALMNRAIATVGNTGISDLSKKLQLEKVLADLDKVGQKGKTNFALLATAGGMAVAGLTKAFAMFHAGMALYLNFDKEMALVSTIVNETTAGMETMRKDVLRISNETGAALAETAKAMYGVITGGVQQEFGFTKEAIATATKMVTEFASIQESSVADTTRAIMGIVNLYGTELGPTLEAQITRVQDVLFQTTKLGITTVQELATSVGMLTPIWKQANLPIEQMGASIAMLTRGGMHTANSVTALKSSISEILKPSQEALALARDLKLDFSKAGLAAKGYADFMDDVMVKTGGSAEKLVILFNNVRALNEVFTKAGGGKEFVALLKGVENSTGVAAEALEKYRNSNSFAVKQIENEWNNLDLALGKTFATIKYNLIRHGVDIFATIADIKKGIQQIQGGGTTIVQAMTEEQYKKAEATKEMADLALALDAQNKLEKELGGISELKGGAVEIGQMTATYLDGTVEQISAAGEKIATVIEKTEANNLAAAREVQFKKEQGELDHLGRMSDYIDSNFKRRLNALKSNLNDEQKIIEAAQKIREGYERRKEASEVSFEEKKNRVVSSGLSATGKDIQSRGMADMYGQRQAAAVKRNDFATALQYANKVQDIFATLASDQNNPLKSADFEAFLESQGQIEKIMAQEQKANDAAMKNAQEKVKALTGDLSALFLNLQKELTIDVSTVAATEQIAELRKSFVELRKDFAGFLPGGSDFQYEKNPEIELFKTKPAEEKKVEKASEKTAQDKTNNTLTSILAEIRKMMDSEREAVVASRKKGFAQDTNGNFIRETVTTMAAGG